MKNKTNGILIFLIITAGIYLVSGFVNFDYTKTAFIDSVNVLIKTTPILIFVFLALIFVNRYLKTDRLRKHLGRTSGFKGWVYAVIIGILLSGPPYVLYPILKEFKDKGMKDSLVAVILYNRNVKIPFIPALIYYFGLTYTIVVSFYIIIFSIFNGLLIDLLLKAKKQHD